MIGYSKKSGFFSTELRTSVIFFGTSSPRQWHFNSNNNNSNNTLILLSSLLMGLFRDNETNSMENNMVKNPFWY